MRIDCPHCGRIGNLPEGAAAPKAVKCPGCKAVFRPAATEYATEMLTQRQDAAPVIASRMPPELPQRLWPQRDDYPGGVNQIVHVNAPEIPKSNALAISALCVGILAALICWVPFLGLVAIPVAVVGVFLAVPGIVLAFATGRTGKAASVVGLVLCVTAESMAYVVTRGFATGINSAVQEVAAQRALADQPVVARRVDGKAVAASLPVVPPMPSTPPERKNEPTADNEFAELGDAAVKIVESRVGIVLLKERFGDKETGASKEPLLRFVIQAVNRSPDKKLTFSPWDSHNLFLAERAAKLTDNFGNEYKMVTFGSETRPVGAVGSGSVYPGRSVIDVLVFEIPVDTMKYLDLELKGGNVSETGVFRFRIPAESVRR